MLSAVAQRTQRAGPTLVLLAPAALLAERAWARRWITDDGFINLRVVRMVLEGHGPVFNIGERVETTTSTIWLWMLVVGDILLPFELEWVAVLLGIALAVGGLVAGTLGAAHLQRGLGATGWLLPVGALVLAVVPPVWEFSTSGLEGGLTIGWLGTTSFLLARWATEQADLGITSAAVAGLGWLVRPDLVVVSAVVVAAVLLVQWRSSGARGGLRLLMAASALPVVYQVFRMGYYANLVPNTVQAKAGTGNRWHVGFDYLRDFSQPYWLVVPLVALCVSVMAPALSQVRSTGNRRAFVALVALPTAGLLHALSIVRVGGDYMHARMLLPSFVAFVMPMAAAPVSRWSRPGARAATGDDAGTDAGRGARPAPTLLARAGVAAGLVVVPVWALICLTVLRSHSVVPDLFTADAWEGHVRLHGEHAVTAADQLPAATPDLEAGVVVLADNDVLTSAPRPDLPDLTYAGHAIGVSGYAHGVDVYVIDMLGLADPVTSRFELSQRGPTGHEKQLPVAWLAARVTERSVPEDVVKPNDFTVPLYESRPGELNGDAAAARLALDCGELAQLREATTDRLTPERFVSNLVEAPRLAGLSVPPDPNAAHERFCG